MARRRPYREPEVTVAVRTEARRLGWSEAPLFLFASLMVVAAAIATHLPH